MKKVTLIIGLLIFVILAVGSISSDEGKNNVTLNSISEKSEDIAKIFNEIGISDNYKLEPDESLNDLVGENTKGYRIKADYVSNVIMYLNEDGSLYSIKYADKDIYSKGKIKDKISDYYITDKEAMEIQKFSIDVIKKVLLSPTSAKFKNYKDWRYAKDKKYLTVQSEVTSKNAFGAEITNEFQIQYDNKTKNIKSVILDGKEYFK